MVALMGLCAVVFAQDEEYQPPTSSSEEFLQGAAGAVERLREADYALDTLARGTNLTGATLPEVTVRFPEGSAVLPQAEVEKLRRGVQSFKEYGVAGQIEQQIVVAECLPAARADQIESVLEQSGVPDEQIDTDTCPQPAPSPAANARVLLAPTTDDIFTPVPRAEMPALGRGVAGARHQVILQPGHYLRTKGSTGSAGLRISEQALVSHIVKRMAAALQQMKIDVLVVSADEHVRDDPATASFEGLSADMFLSVHADGAERPCTTGPSLGYPPGQTVLFMDLYGFSLATSLGYEYSAFRKDNFTANLREYYMYSRIHATHKGVLEVGELTCAKSEQNLIANWRELADNLAKATQWLVVPRG